MDSTGYQAHSSGLLKGGGRKRFTRKHQPSKLPFHYLGDHKGIRELPDFDPDASYTQYDLAMLTEKILLEDPKPGTEHPVWLHANQLRERNRHEIYSSGQEIDPAYAEGLYWRTHPNGLKFEADPDLRRAHGSSFYDGVSEGVSPVAPPPPKPPVEFKSCSFEGCTNKRATKIGVCGAHYQQILRGEELHPLRKQGPKLSPEDERTIQRRYLQGVSREDLALQFGVARSRIDRILIGFETKRRNFPAGVGI